MILSVNALDLAITSNVNHYSMSLVNDKYCTNLEVELNYEDLLEKFYTNIIKENDLVIDIGAHSGRHTKPMASLVGPSGMVMAFEPNPSARQWLQGNLKNEVKNNIVSIFPYALSDKSQKMQFVIANDRPEESGLKKRVYNGPTTTSTIEVEVVTLDSLMDNFSSPVKFIKLDVEGAEFDALKGAHDVLETYKPIIAFEFGESSYKSYNVQPAELYDYLQVLGYRIYSILGEILDKDAFVQASRVQKYWDYIACPEHRIELVESAFRSSQTISAKHAISSWKKFSISKWFR